MNRIVTAAVLTLSLFGAASARAGDDAVLDNNSGDIAQAPRGFIEIEDPMRVLQPYLADDMMLPRQQATYWVQPRLTAAKVQDGTRRPAATGKKDSRLAALKSKYSDLPEPPMASMLLIGLILLFLTVQEEKDEKFTKE